MDSAEKHRENFHELIAILLLLTRMKGKEGS